MESLMREAIRKNLKVRSRIKPEYFSMQQYIHEFCTIRVNLGRQTGKTTWIANHAGPNDMIVVNNHAMKDNMARMGAQIDSVVTAPSFSRYYPQMYRGSRQFVNLYIDDCSMFSSRSIDDIVNYFYSFEYNPKLVQTVFLIG